MFIYYKYAPDGSRFVVVSYVDDCVYWYASEDLGKWLGDNLRKNTRIVHVTRVMYD